MHEPALPIPGTPTTVTRCGRRSARARARTSTIRSRSRSRPTRGATMERSAPTGAVAASASDALGRSHRRPIADRLPRRTACRVADEDVARQRGLEQPGDGVHDFADNGWLVLMAAERDKASPVWTAMRTVNSDASSPSSATASRTASGPARPAPDRPRAQPVPRRQPSRSARPRAAPFRPIRARRALAPRSAVGRPCILGIERRTVGADVDEVAQEQRHPLALFSWTRRSALVRGWLRSERRILVEDPLLELP